VCLCLVETPHIVVDLEQTIQIGDTFVDVRLVDLIFAGQLAYLGLDLPSFALRFPQFGFTRFETDRASIDFLLNVGRALTATSIPEHDRNGNRAKTCSKVA